MTLPHVVLALLLLQAAVHTSAQRLFISKYYQGSGSEQAIEIFNPTCEAIELGEFALGLATDGGDVSLGALLALAAVGTTTVPALGVHSVCGSAGISGVACDYVQAGLDFDGDDAVLLLHNGVVVDGVGEPRTYGSVAGVGWTVAGVPAATVGRQLVRKERVSEGEPEWPSFSQRNDSNKASWTVHALGDATSFGVAHTHQVTCPSTLRRLTCGTKGDSSYLSGSAGESFQVECPGDCHTKFGPVYGRPADGYATSSYVCRAATHEGIRALQGQYPNPDPTLGNAPDSQQYVTAAGVAEAVTTYRGAVDVVLLVDTSSGANLAEQQAFANALFDAFDIHPGDLSARFAVISYNSGSAVQQSLTGIKADLVTAVAALSSSGSGTRALAAGLADAQGELESNGRFAAQKLVLALVTGSISGSPSSAATSLKDLVPSVSFAILSVGTAVDDALVSSTEYDISAASYADMEDEILTIQQLLWSEQQCHAGTFYTVARPLMTLLLESGTAVVAGAEQNCVKSLSLSGAQATFSLSSLEWNEVTCLKGCSGTNGRCNPRTGQCLCNAGFFDDDCSKRNCTVSCLNGGSCDTSVGQCVCQPADTYYGHDCSLKTCVAYNDCSGRGACDASTGLCTCNPPYFGTSCEFKHCLDSCNGNGRCDIETGECGCFTGYSGTSCGLIECAEDCSSRGDCDYSTGQCACDEDGVLGSCKFGTCAALNHCSGNGECDRLTRRCTCKAGYFGSDCSRTA